MRGPVGKRPDWSFATPKAAPKLTNEEFEPGFTVDMTTLRTMKIAAIPFTCGTPSIAASVMAALSLGVGFRAAPAPLASVENERGDRRNDWETHAREV
jgi:hypothetical protein